MSPRSAVLKKETAWSQGSFTVEASLLMTVILPVLLAVLLAGFWVHDTACMQGVSCELSAMTSNLQLYDDGYAFISRQAVQSGQNSCVWTQQVTPAVEMGKDNGSASLSGSFAAVPEWISRFFPVSQEMNGSWARRIYHPADLIRTVRGIHAFIEDF